MTEAPSIVLDPTLKEGLTVKAGETITLSAISIRGKPPPTSAWSKAGKDFRPSELVHIETKPTSSTLSVKYAARKDSGEYTITATNPFGTKQETVHVKVLDIPGPPGPIEISNVSAEKATLTWTPPAEDGGSPVKSYVLEKRETSRLLWTLVAENIESCRHVVSKLIQGNEYVFRVSAVNQYGKGEPVQSEPNLTENEEYTFQVMAVNSAGRSAPRESRPVIIKEQTMLPEFDLRAIYQKTVIAKAGDNIKIEIPVLGRPRPTVTWKKEDQILKQTQRVNYENTATATILTINECIRSDSGQYPLSAKNIVGEVIGPAITSESVVANYPFKVPGPPGTPQVIAVTKETMTISWNEPVTDGGSPILGYHIERKERNSIVWQTVSKMLVSGNIFKSSGLTDGIAYEFRVIAENLAGKSKPSKPSEPVFALDPIDPPGKPIPLNITRHAVTLKLEADVSGRPPPTMTWTKGEKELEDTAKLEIKTADFSTILINKDSSRRDGGAYTLTATNPGGFAKHVFNVKVLDRPGPPEGPLAVSEVTAEKCVLSWLPPLDDGGAKIDHYVVEKRETSRLAWTSVGTEVPVTKLKVTKLLKGNEYVFRVMAVNKYGVGEPLESEPILAVNPYVPPDPPKTPEVTAITKDSMVVCWGHPDSDGGSPITNYIVERRDRTGLRWVKCNKRVVTDLRFKVSGLTEGHEYEYRVMAENAAGVSEPSPASPFYKACDTVFKPGPPGNPRVLDSSKSSITIAWNKPIYDGGSEITGYMVEIALPEEDEWKIVTPPVGLKATSFTITDLKENQEYKIRIYAMNSEGLGEPALVPGTPKAEERIACCTLRLFVPIKGRPAPEVKWTREHGESLDRASIESTSSYTLLIVENVNRFDSGKYILTIENSSGSKTAFVNVRVLDTPGAPQDLKIKEVTKSSVTLTWEPPLIDGGSKIKNYIVEKRESTRKAYSTVNANCHKTSWKVDSLQEGCNYYFRYDGGSSINNYIVERRDTSTTTWHIVSATVARTTIKACRLKTGCEYQFRIAAENRYGKSTYLTSESIIAQYPFKVPGPPGTPFVTNVTKDSMVVQWHEPVNDGGSRIIGYHLERKERNSILWAKLNKTPLPDTKFKTTG
uniref:Titin n=1 Tax=Taeniopygia guttata TaxID=59729 RepID=A0A674HAX0_TAEGU